jgi:hypothetical protein
MKRELRELDRQIVIRFEFLDTPGDEIAPGSDKIGKHFENHRLGHNPSVLSCYPFRIIGFYCSRLAEVKGLSLLGELELRGSGIEDLCPFWQRKRRQTMLVTAIVHNVAHRKTSNQERIG